MCLFLSLCSQFVLLSSGNCGPSPYKKNRSKYSKIFCSGIWRNLAMNFYMRFIVNCLARTWHVRVSFTVSYVDNVLSLGFDFELLNVTC